jgi:Flp pilus assembly protein TadD
LRGARGDLDGAISDFGKTIELNPQNAKAYANRGIIMLLQGRDALAQKEFDMALKIDSTLNPGLQNRVDQIVKGRKSKP